MKWDASAADREAWLQELRCATRAGQSPADRCEWVLCKSAVQESARRPGAARVRRDVEPAVAQEWLLWAGIGERPDPPEAERQDAAQAVLLIRDAWSVASAHLGQAARPEIAEWRLAAGEPPGLLAMLT